MAEYVGKGAAGAQIQGTVDFAKGDSACRQIRCLSAIKLGAPRRSRCPSVEASAHAQIESRRLMGTDAPRLAREWTRLRNRLPA